MFSLTAGRQGARQRRCWPRDREAWGAASAAAALDGFVALDGRMKTIVTAWQMKEVDGQQVLNDHADAAYDARGPGRPGGAPRRCDGLDHARSSAGLPRLARYARRLDAAVAAAAGRRRPLHRLTPRGQLPRRLVRAARGPHPPGRHGRARTRSPPAAPDPAVLARNRAAHGPAIVRSRVGVPQAAAAAVRQPWRGGCAVILSQSAPALWDMM